MNQNNQQAIRILRRETKAGIMDCKNALAEAGGNIKGARELLLQRGCQIAAKKSERIAADGVIFASVINGTAILLEVNTETDFVAANPEFLADVRRIANAAAASRPAGLEGLLQCAVPGAGGTVEHLLQRMTLAFREKIVLRRFAVLDGAMPVAYTHLNGQYGVILTLGAQGRIPKALWEPVGKELALQIAASAPLYVSRESIDAGERGRIEAAIADEVEGAPEMRQKPPMIREKIRSGRTEKYYRKSCLLEQPYIRLPEQTVAEYLRGATAGWEFPLAVNSFFRYQKADGLQDTGEQSNLEYARRITLPPTGQALST